MNWIRSLSLNSNFYNNVQLRIFLTTFIIYFMLSSVINFIPLVFTISIIDLKYQKYLRSNHDILIQFYSYYCKIHDNLDLIVYMLWWFQAFLMSSIISYAISAWIISNMIKGTLKINITWKLVHVNFIRILFLYKLFVLLDKLSI